ncbi:MAG: peptidoglycan editing factor PgeF [Smithellaceae bacterium]|nr:peptidoglycan editing factor PgeF [Smithellaceae bacterium]
MTRQGGFSKGPFQSLNVSLSVGDHEPHVRENWAKMSANFALNPGSFITVRQVHQDRIRVIEEGGETAVSSVQDDSGYDALVTNQSGLAISIKTADCVPVLLFDPVRRVIGAVHAGWRGTALGVAAKTVETFQRRFGSNPGDLIALLGPAIGPCCYQVDRTVFDAFARDGRNRVFFQSSGEAGKWQLDLALLNAAQLESAGLARARIHSSGICTACHGELFFSHRASEGNCGRQLSFIMMR